MHELRHEVLGPLTAIKKDPEFIPDHGSLSGKVVVDVGCGTGEMVKWFSQQGAHAIGVDVEAMVSKARAAHREIADSFLVGTGERLPLGNAVADIALFLASFHHVPESRMAKALAEAKRVMKPGGLLIIIEPVVADGAYSTLTRMVEDEELILEAAKTAIDRQKISGLSLVSESLFAAERTLGDFRKLLQVYVADEERRRHHIGRAEKLTDALANSGRVDREAFTYLSICRRTILKKSPDTAVRGSGSMIPKFTISIIR